MPDPLRPACVSIAVARLAGLRTSRYPPRVPLRYPPRVPLRFTLGYMPSPATHARLRYRFQIPDLFTPAGLPGDFHRQTWISTPLFIRGVNHFPGADQPYRGAIGRAILAFSRDSRQQFMPRFTHSLSDECPRDSLQWDFHPA